ncbi:MAG TPA: hypothetical protein VNV65_10120 [Candidatus Solibacter sp.]|nr:hypothetical protein [Candidatus Solibacter sp.]
MAGIDLGVGTALAYRTSKAVYIAAADPATGQWSRKGVGEVAIDPVKVSNLVWSRDGRFLAWLEESAGTNIAVYDLTSGQLRKEPLDGRPADIRQGIGATATSFIILSQDGKLFVVTPQLGKPLGAPRVVPTTLPPRSSRAVGPRLTGALPAGVIVDLAGDEASAYGGPEQFFFVGLDGAAKKLSLDSGAKSTSVENVAISMPTVDLAGTTFAYVSGGKAGSCDVAPAVMQRRVLSGELVAAGAVPDSAVSAGKVWDVLSVAYGPDGRLEAVFRQAASICDPIGEGNPQVYELRAGHWQSLKLDAEWAAPGPKGATATLRHRDPKAQAGDLSVIGQDGSVVVIDRAVLEAAWGPARAS